MKRKNLFFLVMLVATGCSSLKLSDNQRTILQSRLFPGAKTEDIFNHFKNALSQNRYAIKTNEVNDGIIVASRALPDKDGSRERREEIVINVDNTPQGVRVRVSIQTIVHYSLGGSYGIEAQERAPYEQFFAQMSKDRDESRVPASVKLK